MNDQKIQEKLFDISKKYHQWLSRGAVFRAVMIFLLSIPLLNRILYRSIYAICFSLDRYRVKKNYNALYYIDIIFFDASSLVIKRYQIRNSLRVIEKSLSKYKSVYRCHKSYLVKISEIKDIIVESGSKYTAELKNGVLIPIGRTKYKELKAKWV